jgi:TPP-dependent indolepyruvate ferredoxin oxidoreductase alpha subunit
MKIQTYSYAETIAKLLYSLGVSVVTHVPGYGGSETFAAVQKIYNKDFPISFHEEVAYTVAHGAALVGKRAASIMKTHGFAKATNSIVHSLYAGTTAGLVTFLFDDPEGAHSDNILDIEPIVAGTGVPYKIVTPGDLSTSIYDAYKESEERQLPYFLILDCRDIETIIEYTEPAALPNKNTYERNAFLHVVCPFASNFQYKVWQAKKELKDWKQIQVPTLTLNPSTFTGTAKKYVQLYETFFTVFKTIRGPIVTGDASTASIFALTPFECIDLVTYLGSSTPLAIGAYLAGFKDTWAITGDFSFIAAGHLGLIEALQRNIPLKLIIFSNNCAGATGGQTISESQLEIILAGYKQFIRRINNPQDETLITEVLNEANSSNEMRIVILSYP